jgi:hypothetical protein
VSPNEGPIGPAASEEDVQLLRRIERRSLWLTAVAAGATLAAPGGGSMAATGVVGGALLAIFSYLVIKRSVSGLADRIFLRRQAGEPGPPDPAGQPGQPRRVRPVGVGLFVLRHALLAGIAYAMIARLRLPPLALLGGASVIVLAAAAEIVRRPRQV